MCGDCHMHCIIYQCPEPLHGGTNCRTAMQSNAMQLLWMQLEYSLKLYIQINANFANHTMLTAAQLTLHTHTQICHFYRMLAPKIPGLSRGIVCMILRLAVLIQYQCVMDIRTDIQTTAYTMLAWCCARKMTTSWPRRRQSLSIQWQCNDQTIQQFP